jgi:predicted nucleic acid-binding protein
MPERPIIADSGPLISLARVELLSLLQGLFGVVRIPETVMREVTQGAAEGRAGAADVRAATWIEVVRVDPVAMAGYELLVDAGEAAAIALAKAEGGLLLMDDNRGRRLALRLGLAVKGTLGILVLAKRRGHIERVSPVLEMLLSHGIRISQRLIDATLSEVGEET